jgi:hypothetical protein
VIAIGIGLGLEFKIIEVKNGLSRGGRIGASVVGVALVATSIALYLRPPQTASSQAAAAATATGAPGTPVPTQGAASAAEQSAPTAVPTDVPTAVPTEIPTPAPTKVPTVKMPDIRGLSPKDAARQLAEVGLQLGEPQESCAELGVADELMAEVRKNRIACQSVEPGSSVALQSSVTYALRDD